MVAVVEVRSRTQRIIVDAPTAVAIVNAGPVGPPGGPGPQGAPGLDAQTSVENIMDTHVDSPTPHPAYDDITDLTILLENGLF